MNDKTKKIKELINKAKLQKDMDISMTPVTDSVKYTESDEDYIQITKAEFTSGKKASDEDDMQITKSGFKLDKKTSDGLVADLVGSMLKVYTDENDDSHIDTDTVIDINTYCKKVCELVIHYITEYYISIILVDIDYDYKVSMSILYILRNKFPDLISGFLHGLIQFYQPIDKFPNIGLFEGDNAYSIFREHLGEEDYMKLISYKNKLYSLCLKLIDTYQFIEYKLRTEKPIPISDVPNYLKSDNLSEYIDAAIDKELWVLIKKFGRK